MARLETEKSQRARAESMASRSLKALNTIFDGLAPSRLMATAPEINEDGIELPTRLAATPESIPLLQKLLQSYEEIARESAAFPDLRREAAEAHHRMADLRQRLGRLDEAVQAYETALDLYPPEAVIVRARAYNELGRIYRLRQRDDEANAMHAQAVKELREAEARVLERPESRFELARAYFMSEPRGLLNLPPLGRPGGLGPGGPGGLGPGGPGSRPTEPVRSSQREAIALLEPLADEHPSVPEYRHLLACCYRSEPRGDGKAIKLLRDLVRDFPSVPDYRLDLCEALANSFPRPGNGPPPWSNTEGQQEAMRLSSGLVRDYPNVPEYAAVHARMLDRRALLTLRQGRAAQAVPDSREAYALQLRLVKRYPDIPTYQFWLCLIERTLSESLLRSGQSHEALQLLVTASLRAETLYEQGRLPGAEALLMLINDQLSEAAWHNGEMTLALKAWEANHKLLSLHPHSPGGRRSGPGGPWFGPGGAGGPSRGRGPR
jgi:tetratricopeptide (TPR) repeat protein